MPRVVHFEIHADEPIRAIAFYRSTFGWDFDRWEGPIEYWHIRTGPDGEPGINGGLVRRRASIDGTAITAFVCTIEVPDLEVCLGRVAEQGGSTVVQKMAIPGVGWLAYCKDTEGNIFGLMQPDPGAEG